MTLDAGGGGAGDVVREADHEGVWVLFILRAVGSNEGFKQQVMVSDVVLGRSLSLLGQAWTEG